MPAPAFVEVEFTVAGETQISRQFELAQSWAADLSEPLNELMDMILENVRAQFESEGSQGEHGVWQPLSDAYGKWKARNWPGRPILVRDGGMKGAMLNRTTAVRVSPDRAVYEPKSRTAGYHQSGADWVGPVFGHGEYPHHLPQRRMVDLPDTFKHEAVDRTFARWIQRKLREGRQAGAGFYTGN